MIQMKREFQKEINKLKKQHQQEIQSLITDFAKEKETIAK